MCGRFTLRTHASDLVENFALLRDLELTPRFCKHACRQHEDSRAGVLHASGFEWFFEEGERAQLHRTGGHRNGAVSRDHDNWQISDAKSLERFA